MKSQSTPHYIQSETVESLVDKYLHLWGYNPEQVRQEILTNFEMAESEIQRALTHLERKYSPNKMGNARVVAKSDPSKAPTLLTEGPWGLTVSAGKPE